MTTTSAPQSDATRAWWAYERGATHDVVGTTVDVPVRDGVTIACDLRRPAQGSNPIEQPLAGLVVEFTPYALMRDLCLREADYFAARGYLALVPLLRGVGRSGGDWEHGSFVQGGRDGHDLVEWLAAQSFSKGRVGMLGESFGGQTSYSTAVERPPHLVTIAPMQSPSSLYHDVVFPGGIKATERGDLDAWPDGANIMSEGAIDADAEFAANRAHPMFDDFWRDRAFFERLDAVDVPVLAIGGWADHFFRAGTIANIEALPERTWTVYGPWGHNHPVDLDGATRTSRSAHELAPPLPGGVLLAWVDHFVAARPGVPVPVNPTFTSFEGPVGLGSGWREIDGWDAAGAHGAVLALGDSGALGADGGGAGVVLFSTGLGDDPAAAPVSAAFTSAPLARDEVLLGHPSVTLRLTLDAPDANLYVELLDVEADGAGTLVNDGYLLVSHRESHTDPRRVAPGETVTVRVPIRPQHHRFAAGHRVRLRVSGGAPTLLVPPAAPVTVAVETGASALRMPGFSETR